MIYIFIVTVIMFAILGLIYNKKINVKDITFDEELSPIVEKMEDNIEITKQILNMIGNTHTKVRANKDEKSSISFYNHRTDMITIKNNPENRKDVTRIVHIAHECVHTMQNKEYLVMNKLVSNIQLLYFLFSVIYISSAKNEQANFIIIACQIVILTATFFVKTVIESDASYRSIYVAGIYVKDALTEEQRGKYIKKNEENIYALMPRYYFSLLMQGGIMLLITEMVAIINVV